MMRYQQLRAARGLLEDAAKHLINNPQQITILKKQVKREHICRITL